MEQFNKGTDHALVSQRFSLSLNGWVRSPHRRRLRECFLRRGCLRLPIDFIIVVHKAARYVLDVNKFNSEVSARVVTPSAERVYSG